MIDSGLRKLLIAQIGHELTAHQTYLGIALYFERQSLTRWGKLFREQSREEGEHAMKIMDFLTDNGVEFDLPALKASTTKYESAAAACRRALKSERDVTIQFEEMAAVAAAARDHRGLQFLQWFIEEQVEEESKMQALIDLIDSGINLFQAEPLLDAFE